MAVATRASVGCGSWKGPKGAVEHNYNNKNNNNNNNNNNNIRIIEFILAALRKSVVSCKLYRRDQQEVISAVDQIEIGWPTDVCHVAHVTFDRFHGFLGLPVELEVQVPNRVPSASASVFGVSADSMQCCYDSRGNSVPTILLLMQDKLYSQGGLKAEGIFRINPENSHEEEVRSQLNRGIVPNNIDVHCLAGLIKAWFRELPLGILDGLSHEQVLQCNTEEESVELVKQLQPTELGLLKWAVDLMADVVEQEGSNKMNARNIAVVFAPNMTQMSDPLTALMHAVQVMNLLKTLIVKTLREREEVSTGEYSSMSSHFSDKQEMDTSCELRGPISEGDQISQISEDEKDETMPSIDNDDGTNFLRQFSEKERGKILQESALAPYYTKVETSISRSGDWKTLSKRGGKTYGADTVDKLDSGFPVPLLGVK